MGIVAVGSGRAFLHGLPYTSECSCGARGLLDGPPVGSGGRGLTGGQWRRGPGNDLSSARVVTAASEP
jgi:hypothetical protein